MSIGPWSRRDTIHTLSLGLTVVFGLQMLRVLLPELVFYLRDSTGQSTVIPGIYSVALFSLAFLVPLAYRYLGPKRLLVLVAGGLALARVAEQSVTSPSADLALATLGTMFFLWSIPAFVGLLRGEGREGGPILAVAVLLGFALDTAIKGSFATLDLSWQPGLATHLLISLLVAAQLLLLWRTVERNELTARDAIGYREAAPLVALGPIIFLELLLFQNIGQQTSLTGWSQPVVFIWVVISNALGLAAALAVVAWPRYGVQIAGASLAALLALLALGERTGWGAAMVVLFGQVSLSMALGLVGASIGGKASGSGIARTGAATGLGMLAFLVLAFLYYANYQFDIPGGTRMVPLFATGLIFLSLLVALPQLALYQPERFNVAPVAASLLLLVAPLGYLAGWDEPKPVEPSGAPVRIITYNLHQGFDTRGFLAIEDQARVIEEQRPDIVALQEVSRSWVIDGSFDMLVWLSRRLDMPYVYGPAADSAWGNAVLSRYPLSGGRTVPMPNNDQLQLERSYTEVRIDVGEGEPLTVIVTHLHNVPWQENLRVPQVRALLEAWDKGKRTVVLGDLNAVPGGQAMALLTEGGLVDSYEASGRPLGEGYTALLGNPPRRIDYIWLSPDLRVVDYSLVGGGASDHLGVVATVE